VKPGDPCPLGDNGTIDAEGFCTSCLKKFDLDPPASTPISPEPPQFATAFEQANTAVEAASTEAERASALESWEKRAIDFHERGYQFITLIGFSMAGKSFFTNRVRRELEARQGWNVDPRAQDSIPRTGKKIETTQIVRQGKPTGRRVIADCDGEAYKNAVNELMKGEIGGEIAVDLRRYEIMTTLASAYILMIPADLRVETGDDDLAGRFELIVRTILALQRRLREVRDVRTVLREGLRRDFLEQAIEHEFSSDRPMLVLFSQADRFPEVAPHTDDPTMYAMTHARTLFRTIHNRFSSFRFDFVSAFSGHPAVAPANDAAVDYDLPHSGAVEGFDWVDKMIETRPRNRETRHAIRLRRFVDPAFRRKYKEITR
jgi:hypothetical protein